MNILFFLFNIVKEIWLPLITIVISIANMMLFKLRGIGLSSLGGDYISIIIVLGTILRFYISGISVGLHDYSAQDRDKVVYTALANILIIIGFTIATNNLLQYVISAPLIIWNIKQANLMFDNNTVFKDISRHWNPILSWTREWKILLFISIIAICLEYITFYNGGSIPPRMLK
ncbi:MAG: hypothetical protein JJW01_03060 [Alphaproteobacteria bacterium]|nr:hypothetical protein [Rickettsiales bacterium]